MKKSKVPYKNGIRHKIGYERGYFNGKRSPKGRVFFIYEQNEGKGLVFKFLKFTKYYGNNSGGNLPFTNSFTTFLLKRTKKGFSLLSFNKNKVHNTSNNPASIRYTINSFFKKGGNTHAKRVNQIIKRFAKTNGLKLKINTKEDIDDNLFNILFPALREITDKKVNKKVYSAFSKYLKEPNFPTAIRKCFKAKGNKIISMVCERVNRDKNLEVLTFGALFRNLIPQDYFYQIIPLESKQSKLPYLTIKDVKQIRDLFKNYDTQRLLKFALGSNFGEHLVDTANMYHLYKDKVILPKKPKTIQELHDDLSRQVNRLKNPEISLPVNEKIQKIDGQIIDDLKIIAPKTNHELTDWGTLMSNCIASYWRATLDKQVILLGVLKNDKLTYNIAIKNHQISQFYAKCNQPADPIDKEKVIKFLEENKIINKKLQENLDDPEYGW